MHLESRDLERLVDNLQKDFDTEFSRMKAEATALVNAAVPALKGRIHRDTGALAESASVDVTEGPETWSATISVGGPTADYVYYENAREGHEIFGAIDEQLETDLSAVFGGRPTYARGSVDHSKRESA